MTEDTVKPLDFVSVNELRKHMLLTVESLCKLFKVSRVSYYGYMKGSKLKKRNNERIRGIVRQLAQLVASEQWPNAAVYVADQPTRLLLLQELLDKNNSAL